MKKAINYILAVITLATAMSLSACQKQEPETKENTTPNKETPTTPDEPKYEASFAEKVLTAAAPTHEINGYTETSKETTFLFAEPFHVDSLNRDYSTIALDKERIASLEDNDKTVKVTFADKKSVTLKYQDEVAMKFEESNSVKDYPGESINYAFSVTKIGHGNITASVRTDGKVEAKVSYNKEKKEGEITLSLPTEEKTNGKVTVTITDGYNADSIEIKTSTYYFNVNASPVTLGAALGASATLNYEVDTDIENPEIILKAQEGAFFSLEGKTLTAVNANNTGEKRASYLEISEASGKMKSVKVEIYQETAPARTDVVNFKDVNFKKAMLAIADKDSDGEVSFDEAMTVKEINITGKNVKNLSGLEHFKNVEKLDAQNNSIEDANVISELHFLYWLDLRGNANLKCFDVTGCSFYFDWCRFDINDNLKYTQYKRQVGICTSQYAGGNGGYRYENDPTGAHANFLDDNRQTTDWSRQNNLILVSQHTKGNGRNKIVFTGVGYIDVDIKDGTFQRIMEEAYTTMFERATNLKEIEEYFDIYFMERIADKHNQWLNETYGYSNERKKIFRYAYNLACGYDADYDAYNLRDYGEYNYNVLTSSIDIYPNIKNPFPASILTGTNHPENVHWLNWGEDNAKYEQGISVYSDNTHISDHKDNFTSECYEDFVAYVKESNGIQ